MQKIARDMQTEPTTAVFIIASNEHNLSNDELLFEIQLNEAYKALWFCLTIDFFYILYLNNIKGKPYCLISDIAKILKEKCLIIVI